MTSQAFSSAATHKIYLILLRRSKAFHWRQNSFEILQRVKTTTREGFHQSPPPLPLVPLCPRVKYISWNLNYQDFFPFSNIDPPKQFPSDYIGDPNITYFDDGEGHVPLLCKASLFHGFQNSMEITYMVQWFANGVFIKHQQRCPCLSKDSIVFKLPGDEYKIGDMVSHWVESYFIQYMATFTNPCWALNHPCIPSLRWIIVLAYTHESERKPLKKD